MGSLHLRVGDAVEVCKEDEEGLKGAWYPMTLMIATVSAD
jgi:hypothetical protein